MAAMPTNNLKGGRYMQKAIIGRKVGMTQIFDDAGRVVPVTVIEAGPCTVVQKKTVEKDGYASVQLGYEDIAERKLTKPEAGHLKKAGVSAKRVLKEFKLEGTELNVGDEVRADVFAEGDVVDVTGVSKGRVLQVLSSVLVSTCRTTHTVSVLFTVAQVPWVQTQTRQELCRVQSFPDVWALSR